MRSPPCWGARSSASGRRWSGCSTRPSSPRCSGGAGAPLTSVSVELRGRRGRGDGAGLQRAPRADAHLAACWGPRGQRLQTPEVALRDAANLVFCAALDAVVRLSGCRACTRCRWSGEGPAEMIARMCLPEERGWVLEAEIYASPLSGRLPAPPGRGGASPTSSAASRWAEPERGSPPGSGSCSRTCGAGATSVDEATRALTDLPFAELGYATVDTHRSVRFGFPEVVYGEGKTVEQLLGIVGCWSSASSRSWSPGSPRRRRRRSSPLAEGALAPRGPHLPPPAGAAPGRPGGGGLRRDQRPAGGRGGRAHRRGDGGDGGPHLRRGRGRAAPAAPPAAARSRRPTWRWRWRGWRGRWPRWWAAWWASRWWRFRPASATERTSRASRRSSPCSTPAPPTSRW